MIAFVELLIPPAVEAGIPVPADLEIRTEEAFLESIKHEYPHLYVYLVLQLGRSLPGPTSHWENAQIIAGIPDDVIRQITMSEITALGFQ